MAAQSEHPVVRRATPARWADVRKVLDGSGEAGCWCQAWRGLDAKGISGGKRRTVLIQEQMAGPAPAPGYVAYLNGEPVGWTGVAVRTETPRLRRSRTIPWIDDAPYWVIGCFRILPGFRRRGVARALLDAVVKAARRAGAPGIEAYPIDPAPGERVEVGAGFVGIASMFDAAGFRRVTVTGGHSGGLPRHLVRLDLDSESSSSDEGHTRRMIGSDTRRSTCAIKILPLVASAPAPYLVAWGLLLRMRER